MWNHTIRIDSNAASMLFHSSLFSFCCAFPSILIVDTDYKLCETQKAMLLSRVSLPLNYLAGGGEIAKLPKLEISDQLVSAANVQWPVSSLSFQCIMSCVQCSVSSLLPMSNGGISELWPITSPILVRAFLFREILGPSPPRTNAVLVRFKRSNRNGKDLGFENFSDCVSSQQSPSSILLWRNWKD